MSTLRDLDLFNENFQLGFLAIARATCVVHVLCSNPPPPPPREIVPSSLSPFKYNVSIIFTCIFWQAQHSDLCFMCTCMELESADSWPSHLKPGTLS